MVINSFSDSMAPTIPQFFHGKSIFVTGGTGFMGKVLLSKLLRSLEGIDTIYVLIRSKKEKSATSRLKELLNSPLFESVSPSQYDKLVPVEGDIMELRLGLSETDYAILTQKVSVVFHVAATVRFNESLHLAILINTRATREVVKLCLDMKQLTAFLHVSTTYSNCDLKTVEEQVYPSSVNWQDAIEIAETIDPAIVNTFSNKYIGKKPNTYTFTKSLAEQIIWDHRHVLPIIIFRPSIVVSTWKDPIPGWIDNFNGPVGMMVGAGHGIIRVVMMDPDSVPDYMPVDVAIRAIIVAAYVKSVKSLQLPQEEFVVNCASTSVSVSNRTVFEMGMESLREMPLTNALWIPTNDTTTSLTYFTIKSWFAHLLPALFIDLILQIIGKKPRLLDIQKRIYLAIAALSYFSCQEWEFKNDKFLKLLTHILPEDKEEFDFELGYIDPSLYFRNCVLGVRAYLINDPLENLPLGKKRSKRLYWLDKITIASLLLITVLVLDLPSRIQHLWHFNAPNNTYTNV